MACQKSTASFLEGEDLQLSACLHCPARRAWVGKCKVIFDVLSACGSSARHWKGCKNVKQTFFYMGPDN